MNSIGVADMRPGERLSSYLLVSNIELRKRRDGGDFLKLVLQDRGGRVGAVMWNGGAEIADRVHPNDIVFVDGDLETYRGRLQLNVRQLRLADPEEYDPSDVLPGGVSDTEQLLEELFGELESVSNPHLRGVLDALFEDEEFVESFKRAPGGVVVHHDYVGGLLEHTLAVVRMCRRIAELYDDLDEEILIVAAALHDVGKTKELEYRGAGDHSDAGRLLGHIVLGDEMVARAIDSIEDFPQELAMLLRHSLVSHHGQLEWGSPVVPMTREAMVLHMAENLDARINEFGRWMRDEQDNRRFKWTRYLPRHGRHLFIGTKSRG